MTAFADGEDDFLLNFFAPKIQYILIEYLFAKRRKTKRESKKENAMRATEENSEAGLFLLKKKTLQHSFL